MISSNETFKDTFYISKPLPGMRESSYYNFSNCYLNNFIQLNSTEGATIYFFCISYNSQYLYFTNIFGDNTMK